MVSRREELMRDEFMVAISEVASRYLKRNQMRLFWDQVNERLDEGIVQNNGDLFAQLSVAVIDVAADRWEGIHFTEEDLMRDYALTNGHLDHEERQWNDPETYLKNLFEAGFQPTRHTCIDFLKNFMTPLQAYNVTLQFKWEEDE